MGTVTKLDAATKLPAEPYQETEREREALKDWRKRFLKQAPLPRNRLEKQPSGAVTLEPDHCDNGTGSILQMNAIGSLYVDYHGRAMAYLGEMTFRDGKHDVARLNALAAMVAGIEPRDQLESMLASQMAAIHDCTMTMAARLKAADTIPRQEHAEKALNKLARTFATQVEALKRYRSKGEQRVIVERVVVQEGGQAVVGLVERKGGVEKIEG